MIGGAPALRLRPLLHPCAYLPGRTASFEHFLWEADNADLLAALLESGFRHFGNYFFRPACPGLAGETWCGRCVPLRVDVAAFAPSRGQRRVLRRGAAVALRVGAPEYSDEKFEIYRRHKQRFDEPAALAEASGDSEAFRKSFYDAIPFTQECVWRLDGAIVAVSLLDLAPRAASSIYCFFDPEYAQLSPGTLTILREIDWARERAIPYYYLGYWIGENRSMRYKMEFAPCEVFDGAQWRRCREGDRTIRCEPDALRMARPASAFEAS